MMIQCMHRACGSTRTVAAVSFLLPHALACVLQCTLVYMSASSCSASPSLIKMWPHLEHNSTQCHAQFHQLLLLCSICCERLSMVMIMTIIILVQGNHLHYVI
uniref:Secreted protein n=1 Tax=Lotharella oceanica TaxID=641309 RepID=A0A7S2X885_9EUKA|mmetsp:Transcript_16924/g.32061  ORF Transcript_16924/g.32061 Transcript_16924/m.32061 type:complete len:103 (+) Transcript_16924:69-377(+)